MFKHNLWRLLASSAILFIFGVYSLAQSPLPPEPTSTNLVKNDAGAESIEAPVPPINGPRQKSDEDKKSETAGPTSQQAATPLMQPSAAGTINFMVRSPNERMEMIVHSSRIITIGQKIPQAQVNNPEILELAPLSPTQVQVSAKIAGVTQINLWGEDKKLFTIDVIVYGDAQELKMLLRSQFPLSALNLVPVGNSILISGYVDKAEHIERIVRIAEEYYPKVINNMTVGGVQTVLLHVKVMEVSRTKLRRLGFDWAKITGSSTMVSGISGLAADNLPDRVLDLSGGGYATRLASPSTFAFQVVNGSSSFFGVLDALRQDNLMKIMAEPTLVAESGRAAKFHAGGTIFLPEPQSLGTISLQPYNYGTQIDFVPIVLGNGKIRLEVRPNVSELDYANSITIAGTQVPGIRQRDADTAVEMSAGQTLAIAGLVQMRSESENHGLPWISEVPYIGAAFRKVHETVNEVELLIMVTPELVDGMDACEVPPCGPGMDTTSPTDWELYIKGHLEVPNCCPTGGGGDCPRCAPGANGPLTPAPEEGMIGPEQISTPPTTSGAGKGISRPGGRNTQAMNAQARLTQRPGGSSTPYNHYTSSKPNNPSGNSSADTSNSPPGFIGPVGYDVVK